MIFIFDLDGTVTSAETLPYVGQKFSLEADLHELTVQTLKGDIPFEESFIQRVELLSVIDAAEISEELGKVEVNGQLKQFINENWEICRIATGNFAGWVDQLVSQFDCKIYASEGVVDQAGKVHLSKILRKQDVVRAYQGLGEKVVFIGDGNNDAEAMRLADVSIACGLVHPPAQSVLAVADYAVYDSSALIRLLKQIQEPRPGKSVVISAAGIGSRLGLGQTKSLVSILGTSLIGRQLLSFVGEEDVRVVVGYQCGAVIAEVLSYRSDVIFVFNHDYFSTKTAASLCLGARHANELIFAWDGDLLMNPKEMLECLASTEEFLGVSTISTEDGVFVDIDSEENVVGFSRAGGSVEWSGPACLRRDRLSFSTGHVFEMVEPLLPIKSRFVEALDIDTYPDYLKAREFVASWPRGNRLIDNYYSRLAKEITSPLATRNKSKDFTQFDVNLVKKYGGDNHTLLDLGSGTGLLLNGLLKDFSHITAVEKYKKFSDFIPRVSNVDIVNDDLFNFNSTKLFDVITIFGVMNLCSEEEAMGLYFRPR